MQPATTFSDLGDLTLLPTGQILLSGGLGDTNDRNRSSRFVPYLWDPSTTAWSDSFAPNPAIRQYHIFDVQGRKVGTLVHGVRPPGSYDIQWRHRGAEGVDVIAPSSLRS